MSRTHILDVVARFSRSLLSTAPRDKWMHDIEQLEGRRLLTTYSLQFTSSPSSTVTIDYSKNYQTAHISFGAKTTFAASQNDANDYISGVDFSLDLNGGTVVASSINAGGLTANSDGTSFSVSGNLGPANYSISEDVTWDNSNRGVKNINATGTVHLANRPDKGDSASEMVTIPAGSFDMTGVSGTAKQTVGGDVLLNNDDDNNDGIPDNHNDFTTGEQDLVALTLHNSGAGGRYQLDFADSGANQVVKVWAKSDKSASDSSTHIVGGTGAARIGSEQTIIDASVDTTLYIEGVAPGSDVITLRWKSDTVNSAYNNADQLKVNVSGIEVSYDGTDDTSKNVGNKLIGQKIDAPTVQAVGKYTPADTDYRWAVDGQTISNYVSTVGQGVVTPFPKASGDLNHKTFPNAFYWTKGLFTGQTLSVVCTVTLSPTLTVTRSISFSVYSPRVDQFSTQVTGQRPLVANATINGHPGAYFGNDTDPGISWTGKATMPSVGGGNISVFQTTNFNFSFTKDDPTSTQTHISSNNAWVLDALATDTDPYYDGETAVNASQQGTSASYDYPGYGYDPAYKSRGLSAQFKDDLMYMPSGTDSIWVPLSLVTWNVSFSSTKNVATGVWSVDPMSVADVDPNGVDSDMFPEWSTTGGAIRAAGQQPGA